VRILSGAIDFIGARRHPFRCDASYQVADLDLIICQLVSHVEWSLANGVGRETEMPSENPYCLGRVSACF
jgi:hypothetical protein